MASTFSRYNFYLVIGTFTLLSVLGQVSTSIYTPFFHDLAHNYDSHISLIEKSVAIFLIAFSASQLLSGILCDYISKRFFLLCGILVFMGGTLLVALADSDNSFLFGRIVQGLGGGVGVSVSRGLSRQIFDEKQLSISLSITNMAFAIAPAIAPLLGTIIGEQLGVSAIFYFVLAIGGVALLLLLITSETISLHSPAISPNVSEETFRLIKKSSAPIILVGVASGLLYGIVFCFVTIAPSMIMDQHGLSKTLFSIYSLLATLSFVAGSILNIRLSKWSTLLKFRLSSVAILSLSVLISALTFLLKFNGLVIMLAYSYATFFFIGIAMPCSVTIMLSFSAKSAGFLAALVGFFHLSGAAAGAYLVAYIGSTLLMLPAYTFVLITTGLCLLSVTACLFLKQAKT
ncbi:MFS transporter [Alteromonas genovensis]|uniref:MFS transporter n=1 Tax=Alteromonas genovensis TaxID=471225 RepID=A0A6N9TJB9_9ALTE|nr:MFS transporter [Alteromonas genovensis]NDW16195.1 MFS transporter [Alteromonas genovensis]